MHEAVLPSVPDSTLQPRRRQVVFGGMTASGSSDSNSSSGGADSATGCAVVAGTGLGRRGVGIGVATGCGGGAAVEVFSSGSGAGESSIVECLPLVQGGIDMNSSNVRTRGLQHFQPVQCKLACSGKFGVLRVDVCIPFWPS